MTSFGEISSLWEKIAKSLGYFWMVDVVFAKLLYQLWYFYATG